MSRGGDTSGVGVIVIVCMGVLAAIVYKLAAMLGADFKSTLDMLLRLLSVSALAMGSIYLLRPSLKKLIAGVGCGIWWTFWPILDNWNMQIAPAFLQSSETIWWDSWWFKFGIEGLLLGLLVYLIFTED